MNVLLTWAMRVSVARMPRFLNTWTGEFEWHSDPSTVTYAILSHVWREPEEGGEQSYDDVRRIQAAVNRGREGPQSSATDAAEPAAEEGTIFAHPGLSDKIRGFCKVARDAGFGLAWNDACCIDKTSSAELSEAINSMYEWYRLSDMCYVYLADVPDGDVPTDSFSSFRDSKWHRRGWTLQELIAPEHIIFLTRTWNVLGTKMTLARTLEVITGVDFSGLVGRSTLDSVSVARRMSWAAERNTTRVEDRAYSLFGIFGLHMSPIYGEGEHAFLRLQEEIIRTIPDQSIFVWGARGAFRLSEKGGWSVDEYHYSDDGRGLLTSSPSSFSYCSDITSIASSFFAQTLRIQESQVPPVHCIFTPEGVSMRFLCLQLSAVPDIRKAFQGLQSPRNTCSGCTLCEVETLAVLQCQARERRETGTTSIIGLPLRRSRRGGSGSNRGAFSIGGHIHDGPSTSRFYRAVRIEIGVLMTLLEHVRPTVEDVTILRHHSGHSIPKDELQQRRILDSTMTYHLNPIYIIHRGTVFTISPHSMNALGTLGIVPSDLQVTRSELEIILETTLEFHGAGTTYVVALRLSLTGQGPEVEACFSAGRVGVIGSGSGQFFIGAAASHHAVGNTPRIPGTFLDLENYGHISTLMRLDAPSIFRPKIISTEFTVGSEAVWGGSARLLRIALQHPFATPVTEYLCPEHLWLSIDISEEHPYASRTESATDSPTSGPTHPEATRPSDGSGQRDQESFGDTGAQHVGCGNNPRRCENATLRAEIEQLKKRNAELAGRMDAVVARLDASTASSGASSLSRYAEQLAAR